MTPSDMAALQKLRIVIRAAQRHSMRVEKQCGVTGAQLWVLKEVHESPGLRVGDISARMAIHQTTTSNLVDSLAKKGLVTKSRDQNDQRVVTLQLTKKGAKVLTYAPTPERGLLPDSLRKLDSKDLRSLNKGLQALLIAMVEGDEAFALQPMPFNM
ncbi:MarR family transcriptional regulator [Herbaspirillum sp. HC18]|nr:MarR family transcriptional regulator [Herbaspirillum sp. HC18]